MTDTMFVLMYLATPMMITWSRRSAEDLITRMPEADQGHYSIQCVPLQSPQVWLSTAMQWAAEHTPEGEDPVVVPDPSDALDWAVSEIGEAVGARVASRAFWRRNHPEKHTSDSVDHELGQAIMMAILAMGESPVAAIRRNLVLWGFEDTVGDSKDPYTLLEQYHLDNLDDFKGG